MISHKTHLFGVRLKLYLFPPYISLINGPITFSHCILKYCWFYVFFCDFMTNNVSTEAWWGDQFRITVLLLELFVNTTNWIYLEFRCTFFSSLQKIPKSFTYIVIQVVWHFTLVDCLSSVYKTTSNIHS